jgi:hypothetical protein
VAIDRPSRGKKSTTQEEFDKLLQKKCPWHPGANHAAIDCYHLRRTFSNPGGGKKNKKPADKEPKDDDHDDSGSGLNLIFVRTLKKMGLDFKDMLVPSKSPFYGIVPGNAVHPLGTVVLPVTFGTRENYRTEFIKFEVATFESSYHAIVGRSALAKFMAVPHYVYLLLKMPGLGGVLTLRGDLKKSYDCNQEAIQYASTTRVPDASGEVLTAAQQLSQSRLEIPSKKASKSSNQSTDDVALKAIQLMEGDSSKTAVIGAGLGDK